MMIKFSVLVPTINRTLEIKNLFNSIIQTRYENIEILIIDQNPRNILDDIIKSYKTLKIKHIKSEVIGLSHNRNVGLKHSEGEWIILADDDAIFDEKYFHFLNEHINEDNRIQIWVSNVRNLEDHLYYTHAPTFNNHKFRIYHFPQICSISLVLKKSIFNDLKGFDENFGVGAQFGACEESDLTIRAFINNYQFGRANNCDIYHPRFQKDYKNHSRIKNYSLGFGALYRKHINNSPRKYKIYFICSFLYLLFRSTIGIAINIFSLKRSYYYKSLRYKIKGFLLYKYLVHDKKNK